MSQKQIASGIGATAWGGQLIPVEIYGVDTEVCEEFFEKLPSLVADITEDTSYSESLYSVTYGDYHSQIRIADEWAGNSPYV